MIRVHHLNNSRSQRVLWLLEELGVPYEITRYQRNKATMLAPDEMKRVHPLGKSPVIEDEGTTFAETGLIVEYLVERYGPELRRRAIPISIGATATGCIMPKARRCRRCSSS
jgi:glutathione S-transferase